MAMTDTPRGSEISGGSACCANVTSTGILNDSAGAHPAETVLQLGRGRAPRPPAAASGRRLLRTFVRWIQAVLSFIAANGVLAHGPAARLSSTRPEMPPVVGRSHIIWCVSHN